MIYMFISVILKIVFEDGPYHYEQIKLEFRINEICFGSMYNVHNVNLHGMLALLFRFLCQKLWNCVASASRSITAVFSVKLT